MSEIAINVSSVTISIDVCGLIVGSDVVVIFSVVVVVVVHQEVNTHTSSTICSNKSVEGCYRRHYN